MPGLADDLVQAIREGDLTTLGQLLAGQPELATGRGARGPYPLHVLTDWPGYLSNGPATARLLIAAGADPSAVGEGRSPESPLHWAASNDDVDVAEVLIDAGADLETPGGSIGTPLDNAVGYGCWHVARLLVQRGARVDKLWQAAALGLTARVDELLATDPGSDEMTHAFWQACHGGQLRVAQLLLQRGADPTVTPDYASGTVLDIAAGPDTRRELLVTWLRDNEAPD